MPVPLGAGSTPPGPVGQSLEEEIACMRSVVQCLVGNLKSLKGDGTDDMQLSVGEMREFVGLVGSLVESDTSSGRLKALLLDEATTPVQILLDYAAVDVAGVGPCLHHRETFTEVGFVNVQVQCLQTLTGIASSCCAASVESRLSHNLFQLLTSTGVVDMLLRFLSDQNCAEQIRTAAAESLYVFISKIDEAKEAVVRLHAVPFFFDVLWKEPCKMVRNYLCAMLKVVAEQYSEQLLDTNVVEKAVSMLQHEASKHVAIMLIDIITLAFEKYEAFYITRVHGNLEILSAMCQLCEAVLHKNTQPDIVGAVTKLIEVVTGIEAADRVHTKFTEMVWTSGCWKVFVTPVEPPKIDGENPALNHQYDSDLMKIKCFKSVLLHSTTTRVIEAATDHIVNFFPAVSSLLNVPLSQSHQPEIVREVALVLCLLLTKHPDARRFFKSTLSQYSSWATALHSKLHDILSQIDPKPLEDMYVVDVNQAYINNPSVVEANFNDMGSVLVAARELLSEQEVGVVKEGGRFASPGSFAKARGFELADPRRRSVPSGVKKQRLTMGLFNYVVTEVVEMEVRCSPERWVAAASMSPETVREEASPPPPPPPPPQIASTSPPPPPAPQSPAVIPPQQQQPFTAPPSNVPLTNRPAWPPWPPPASYNADPYRPPARPEHSTSPTTSLQRSRSHFQAQHQQWTPGQPVSWSHLSHDQRRSGTPVNSSTQRKRGKTPQRRWR